MFEKDALENYFRKPSLSQTQSPVATSSGSDFQNIPIINKRRAGSAVYVPKFYKTLTRTTIGIVMIGFEKYRQHFSFIILLSVINFNYRLEFEVQPSLKFNQNHIAQHSAVNEFVDAKSLTRKTNKTTEKVANFYSTKGRFKNSRESC